MKGFIYEDKGVMEMYFCPCMISHIANYYDDNEDVSVLDLDIFINHPVKPSTKTIRLVYQNKCITRPEEFYDIIDTINKDNDLMYSKRDISDAILKYLK